MIQYLWLIPLGVAVGAFGTLIGAGGGFVLMPVLLLLYPNESPRIITSISLAVVFFNALSGSIAYARMKRIEIKAGLLFSVAAAPGAVLGALTTSYIRRREFDAIFGILMIAVSVYLIWSAGREKDKTAASERGSRRFKVDLVDSEGARHIFSYNPALGVAISVFVGFISSLLGIGGGIIHVPAMVYLLDFPVHIATATSHFILATMSLTGTVAHIVTGAFTRGVRRTICLAIGVLIGAQIGAAFSNRVKGAWIIRGLAIALGLVGLRILFKAVM
ncbi:MAG: sulfite exporter TauE/SafE family protein [bacterium]